LRLDVGRRFLVLWVVGVGENCSFTISFSPIFVVWRGSPLLGAGTIVPAASFPLPQLNIADTTDLLLIANIYHVDPLSQATCSELDEIYLRRTNT
jgi:hypothetical protein